MTITFLEAIIWLAPLMGFHVVVALLKSRVDIFQAIKDCNCPRSKDDKSCDEAYGCYVYDFIRAFVLAAFLEEVLKYLCIRRITFSSFVVDARSLFIYGGCGALGFATVENILYVLQGGENVAIVRSVLSVPGHMAWGLLQGCALGRRRFLNSSIRFHDALLIPVLSHGFFDVFLFWSSRYNSRKLSALGVSLTVWTAIATWLYVRGKAVNLERVPNTDVHKLIREGIVKPPNWVCCMCRWAPQSGSPDGQTGPKPAVVGAFS